MLKLIFDKDVKKLLTKYFAIASRITDDLQFGFKRKTLVLLFVPNF